ncbi:MarR family winged helix-turn-helix transcriptional regulator [Lysinibacillus sp. NPDC056232]|uniref:MarR family winged helix-turn-helix transcriptional regulator n=1 Tax=Lysinibacillus sp. NPDC056232 TaxID=3345756 RepID=UPI0035E31002
MSMENKTNSNHNQTENNILGQEFSSALIMFHQEVANKLDLNITDYKVLGIIPNGGITAGEIAIHTGLSTGMVTTVVDRLEKKNYVYRDKHPSDRRKVIIKNNIEKTYTELAPIFQSFGVEMRKIYSSYNDHEIKTIMSFLNKSIEVFKKETAKLKNN